jgi:hypothetical protein
MPTLFHRVVIFSSLLQMENIALRLLKDHIEESEYHVLIGIRKLDFLVYTASSVDYPI